MPENQTDRTLPLKPLWMIAPFFLWGTAMVAMKGTIPHTTPFFIAIVRLIPAGFLILAIAALLKRPQPTSWQAWLWIGLFGLIDGALFQGFLAQGLVRTGAGLGSVMIDSQPLAVALMARIFFGEIIGLWGSLGLAFGIVGISFLGLPDSWILSLFSGNVAIASLTQEIQNGSLVNDLAQALFHSGEWLMLLAALSMAAGTVMVRMVSRYADPIVATGWHMILGGLPLVMLSLLNEQQQWQQLNLSDWFALGYSSIFGSAIAYGLFFYFASKGNLTSLSSLTFLTPVFALLFGNLILSETLTNVQWTGVGITLVSIYLVNQREVLTQRIQTWRGQLTTTTLPRDRSETVSPDISPDIKVASSSKVD